MAKLIFEGTTGYGDTGIEDFSFIYDGDRYKVLPKYGVPGALDKLQKFMSYVKFVAPKAGNNPWAYAVNPEHDFSKVFTIYKNGEELKKSSIAPDAEQLSLPLTAQLDRLSSRLEERGLLKEAYRLDIVANTIEDAWHSNKATLFFDEVYNQGIDPFAASRVIDIARQHGLRSAKEEISENDRKVDKREPERDISQAKVFLHVPLIRQSTAYSCGAACFLSILGYYGLDLYEKQIMDAVNTDLGGTNPNSFEKPAKKFGLTCKIKEGLTVEDVKKNLDDKIPMILDIQAWGKEDDYSEVWKDGHYVVAIGYDKNGFYLMDPSQIGFSYLPFKELMDRWHDFETEHGKRIEYVQLGMSFHGKKPKFDYTEVKPVE